jgi:hypothetical protein
MQDKFEKLAELDIIAPKNLCYLFSWVTENVESNENKGLVRFLSSENLYLSYHFFFYVIRTVII